MNAAPGLAAALVTGAVAVATSLDTPTAVSAALSAPVAALSALFATAFDWGGSAVTWAEIVAFVLSIAMVFANMRVNPLGWPLAIVASLLYFGLFWRSRLYGDAGLQIFFAALACWGWWQWRRGRDAAGDALAVRRLSPRARLAAVAAFALAWPAMGLFLRRWTDTDVPWWDAFPTAGSLIGQWLLGRKFLENWAAWVVVNAASVGLYAYKGLRLTSILYAIFLALSFAGWRAWRARLAAR